MFCRCFISFEIAVLVDYFQAVRMFVVFSFYKEFFHINLRNIFLFANCIIWVSHYQNYRIGTKIKIKNVRVCVCVCVCVKPSNCV